MGADAACALLAPDAGLPDEGFAWLDLPHDEVDQLQASVLRLTGMHLFEVHVADARNTAHPSFFDSTDAYEIVVFRGLSPASTVAHVDRSAERSSS